MITERLGRFQYKHYYKIWNSMFLYHFCITTRNTLVAQLAGAVQIQSFTYNGLQCFKVFIYRETRSSRVGN